MWILILFVVIAAILFYVCNFFYHLAIRPGKKPFLKGNKDLPESFLGGVWVEGKEWLDKVRKTYYSIKSTDGLDLKAFFIPSSSTGQKVFVVIAHGYNSKNKDLGAFVKFFNEEMNFNVLAPDNRGHGDSGGKYIGFGWHDRSDYIEWVKFLIKTYGKDIKILLFGISMGGSTVLMLSGEKLPKNVKAIISDCAYTSAMDVLAYQLKRQYGLPPIPLIYITSLITKIKAGYFLSEASAIKQVKKATLPILFIHGREDTFVPFEMVHRLYEACASDKKLLEVDEAGHGEGFIKNNDKYREAVKEFIRGTV